MTITLDARAQQRLQLPQPVLTWRQDDIGYAGDFCGVVVVADFCGVVVVPDQPSVAVGLVPHAARPSPWLA